MNILLTIAQTALLQALSMATKWGWAKIKEFWDYAKKRALELEGDTSLTGKQKGEALTGELRSMAQDLSPDATDLLVEQAMSKAEPFLSQIIEILIPFAVIIARATKS